MLGTTDLTEVDRRRERIEQLGAESRYWLPARCGVSTNAASAGLTDRARHRQREHGGVGSGVPAGTAAAVGLHVRPGLPAKLVRMDDEHRAFAGGTRIAVTTWSAGWRPKLARANKSDVILIAYDGSSDASPQSNTPAS